tara:strand:+ start:38 stop:286 length:249 start_codon:yes stop_codon:yes gene_type:complete
MRKDLLNKLPDDILNSIKEEVYFFLSAYKIQKAAIMMFYKKYGIIWHYYIYNFNEIYDYYCYINNIIDPPLDYFNYYREIII